MVVSWRRRCPARAVAAPLWLFGCSATVYPPPDVAEPSQVGVLDHGQHSSLILQIPEGMVRYSYGDWQWYALRQTGPIEGSSALFWPSAAALGRKQLLGPFSPAAVAREVRVLIEHTLYVTVEASDVQLLVARLDRIYEENPSEQVDNAAYDLMFVPYPEPYSMFHNSNQVVAGWLEQLGCRVEGTTLFSVWELGTDRS
jgi:hypothetical protein